MAGYRPNSADKSVQELTNSTALREAYANSVSKGHLFGMAGIGYRHRASGIR